MIFDIRKILYWILFIFAFFVVLIIVETIVAKNLYYAGVKYEYYLDNKVKSKQYFQRASKLSFVWFELPYNIYAEYELGIMDNYDAFYYRLWLHEMVKTGIAEYQYLMGKYQMGSEPPDEAIEWFQRAADQGHQEAKEALRKIK